MSAAAGQKYQLLAELGHGGMADVYLAVLCGMQDFRKLAVVKRLRPHLADDPDFLEMFLQEARIAARLNHPNVVHTFEVGYDGERHFMAMEYLEGHSYSALLNRAGRDQLDFNLQLTILIDVLAGLHYTHDLADFDGKPLGLVHRDVTPQNVFVTYDGQVKLLDFGIAKARDSEVETGTGIVKGNLAYMPPEQALANPLDRRSDLYSVGVLLWEAAAQRRRWAGVADVRLMKEIVGRREVVLPDFQGKNLPPSLAKVLTKALAYDPEGRYATALEMQAALELLQDELHQSVTKKQIGKLVSELFAEDHARIRATIEGALHDDASPVSNEVLSDPRNSFTPTQVSPTAPPSGIAISDQRAGRKRRRALPVVGTILVGAVVAGVTLLPRGKNAGSNAAVSAATPPPPRATTVRLHVSALPASATLFLDDKPVSNPFSGQFPGPKHSVRVRAECAGYVTDTRALQLTGNTNLQIELTRSHPSEPTTSEPDKPSGKRIRSRVSVRPPPGASAAVAETPSAAPFASAAPSPRTTASVMKAPPRKTNASVKLDTTNPWSN